MACDWTEDEPGWSELKRELSLAKRRMRRRWLLTTLLALLIAGGTVIWRATRHPSYRASIVIRLVEKGFDPDTRPPTVHDITKYFYDIALSRPTLKAVIDEHDLYPERRFDPTWAVDSMKEDIHVRVVANYFSPETWMEHPLREARVVISYDARTPQQALDVVRELGQLIAARETAARKRVAALTAAAGADAHRALRREALAVRRQITELNLHRHRTPLDLVHIRQLGSELLVLDERLNGATRTSEELSLRKKLEDDALGLRFEVIDDGKLPQRHLTRNETLAIIGAVVFLFALPVVGVGISGFDTHIYDADSLRHLPLRCFGDFSAFPGVGRTTAHTRGRT